jgi:hypothetical protein
MNGGLGKNLMKHGLKELRKCRRPAYHPLELALEQECMWACYRGASVKAVDFSGVKPNYSDGSPLFGDADVEQFVRNNKLQMIIRSRQVIMDGVLNLPARMLVSLFDFSKLLNFRQFGPQLLS